MKKLSALLLLLSACQQTSPPVAAPTQLEADRAAILAHVSATENDPASYELVELRRSGDFTRGDSLRLRFIRGDDDARQPMSADSARRCGRLYFHKYRAKNALGGLVLTWNYAVVPRSGEVFTYKF